MTTPRSRTAEGQPPRLPAVGETLFIGPAASVQFSRPILIRVIAVNDQTSCDGWIYIDGYQITKTGQAIERRTIFVQAAGLVLWRP